MLAEQTAQSPKLPLTPPKEVGVLRAIGLDRRQESWVCAALGVTTCIKASSKPFEALFD